MSDNKKKKKKGPNISLPAVGSPVLPFSSHVTLGMLLNVFVPQFSYLLNGNTTAHGPVNEITI